MYTLLYLLGQFCKKYISFAILSNYRLNLILASLFFHRVRDFWSEQGPTDILLKLKRKEITLFRAAEQLNVTPQTLSNYLISMSQLDSEASTGVPLVGHTDQYEEAESEEDTDSILPDVPSVYKGLMQTATTSAPVSNSVLAHCPDITIIKKEKMEGVLGKVNNNSDHSERSGEQK